MTDHTIVRKAGRRRMAWLLSLAVCLAALLPSMGMVLRAVAPDQVSIEICSAQGSRFIQVAANDVPVPTPPTHDPATPHCPLCIAPAGTDVLPAANASHVPVWEAGVIKLAAATADPFLPAVSSGRHLARAPPSFA